MLNGTQDGSERTLNRPETSIPGQILARRPIGVSWFGERHEPRHRVFIEIQLATCHIRKQLLFRHRSAQDYVDKWLSEAPGQGDRVHGTIESGRFFLQDF